jgi:hypothetical protein
LKELESAKEAFAIALAEATNSKEIANLSSKIQILNMQIQKCKNEKTFWFDSLPNNPIRLIKNLLSKSASQGI